MHMTLDVILVSCQLAIQFHLPLPGNPQFQASSPVLLLHASSCGFTCIEDVCHIPTYRLQLLAWKPAKLVLDLDKDIGQGMQNGELWQPG
jgi:hypothetical protein